MKKTDFTKLAQVKLLLATLFVPFLAVASDPLVNVMTVEPWENGVVSNLNCQVAVPYLKVYSSESDAKLIFLLPKGTEVKKGELIAEQDDYYLQQQLVRLEQQKQSSEMELKYSTDEHRRLSDLPTDMVSPSELNNLSLKRVQAKLNSSVISNEIAELKYRIKNLKHYAANNGIIAQIYSRPGEFLHQGNEIVSFLPDVDKEIDCEVPIARFDKSKIKTQSKFTIGDTSFKVKRVNQITDKKSQFVNVYLAPVSDKIEYLLGQRVKVKMAAPNIKLTRLPVDSLNLASSGDYVWKVSDDGAVEKVAIKVVVNQQGYFLVDSTLKSGDRVVTLGKTGLKSNQKVKYYQTKGSF